MQVACLNLTSNTTRLCYLSKDFGVWGEQGKLKAWRWRGVPLSVRAPPWLLLDPDSTVPGLLTVDPPALPVWRGSQLYGLHGSLHGLGDDDQKSNPARNDGEKASLLPVLLGLGEGVERDAGECFGVKLQVTGRSLCRVLTGLDHQPTLPGVNGCLLLPAERPGDGELLDNVAMAGGKPAISTKHTQPFTCFNTSSSSTKISTDSYVKIIDYGNVQADRVWGWTLLLNFWQPLLCCYV